MKAERKAVQETENVGSEPNTSGVEVEEKGSNIGADNFGN